MGWKTLDDMELAGKRVLTRVDINVPMQDGQVTDATRIEKITPTVRDILAAVGPDLLAHFGRPRANAWTDEPAPFGASIGTPPIRPRFVCGRLRWPCRRRAIGAAQQGQVVCWKTRVFTKPRKRMTPILPIKLAALGDVYCNDAFSAAHRACLDRRRGAPPARLAGRLMQTELSALEAALATPNVPLLLWSGGESFNQIELLGNLVAKVDYLVIGGGMANTFLAAQGVDVGKSLAEHDMTGTATDIWPSRR